jgi:hypothetical protein
MRNEVKVSSFVTSMLLSERVPAALSGAWALAASVI